jgi:EmrB/QacA subfamily drug resistance transporter
MGEGRMLNRVLLAAILGSGLVFLDGSVANIILPKLQDAFHRSLMDLQWVVTSYGITLSALLLLGGALGDRYGRRRIFLAGLTLFSLASAACAASPNFWGLIAARSVQGVGGALLTPESLAILNATFPRDRRAKAIGIWSAASALIGVFAPPLAGWIAEMGSWRAVFLINLPIAAVAGYLGWKSIPVSCMETRSARFDVRGSLLAPLGLGILVYGMMRGVLWTLGGLGVLGLFFLHEFWAESRAKSRGINPLLPLRVFKNQIFSRINLMTFFLYAGFSMVLFYIPTQLIRVEHYSAAQAGLALAPLWLLIALLSQPVGTWMVSLGTRVFLIGGSVLVALGCVVLSLAPATRDYFVSYLPGFLLMGIGFGLTATPLTSRALSSLGDEESGLASGINNAVAHVAGIVGVALAAGLLTWSFRGFMGPEWRKDPLMDVPRGSSQVFKEAVDMARRSSYNDLLWGSAAASVLAGMMVMGRRKVAN